MKKWLSVLFCALVYSNITKLYNHHRYRVEYAYCPAEVKHVGRLTLYPSHITVYQGSRDIGQLDGDYVIGRRGKDRSQEYIRAVLTR